MTLNIVTVNVTQTIAPAPNLLQQTGALLSQGGTILPVGTYAMITQPADLTPLLTGAASIATMTWASGTVTVNTGSAHGYTVGQAVPVTIIGAVPVGYNVNTIVTITSVNAFTFALATNPGTVTVLGAYLPSQVAELTAMVTTYFAQGSNGVAIYVLELGKGTPTTGTAQLTTFITNNAQFFYAYCVSKYWDGDSTYIAMLASFENTTAKTYFFTTTTTNTFTYYTALMKCVFCLVQAPAAPATEFTVACAFYRLLNYAPSTSNLVTPFAFGIVYGVTPYPISGNAVLLQTLKTAFVNYIGTGIEGGISNTVLFWGTTMDGHDFTYWYSVDWVQININLDLSNEIINGSNNPINPLYYDQDGINRLQARAQLTMSRGVAFGLVLPPVTVNAVPFQTYVTQNPSDYPIGKYAGLSVTYTPQRGFTAIYFNVNVTQFPAGA